MVRFFVCFYVYKNQQTVRSQFIIHGQLTIIYNISDFYIKNVSNIVKLE